MSIKLYCDDIRREPEGWHRARTVTEAIRILDTQDVSECSLDYDISHIILPGDEPRPNMIYQGVCCPETYEPVARFIARAYKPGSIKITIHTANPIGADKMNAILVGFGAIITLSKPCLRPGNEE